jgi:multidrug resistance efflux pump
MNEAIAQAEAALEVAQGVVAATEAELDGPHASIAEVRIIERARSARDARRRELLALYQEV